MSGRRSRLNSEDPEIKTDPKAETTGEQDSSEATDETKSSMSDIVPPSTPTASISSGATDEPDGDDSQSSSSDESNGTQKKLRSAAKKKRSRKSHKQTLSEETIQTQPLSYEEETTSMQKRLEQLQLPTETDSSQSFSDVDTSNIAAVRPKTLPLLKDSKVKLRKLKKDDVEKFGGVMKTPLTQKESSPGIAESMESEDVESQLKSTSETDSAKKFSEVSRDKAVESDERSEEYSDCSIVGGVGSSKSGRTYSDTEEKPRVVAENIESHLESTASKNTERKAQKKIRVPSKLFLKFGSTDTGSETPPTEDFSLSSTAARAGSFEEEEDERRKLQSTSTVSNLSIASISSDSVFHHDSTAPSEPSICSNDSVFDQSPKVPSLKSVDASTGDSTKNTISVSRKLKGHSVLTKTSSGKSKLSSDQSKISSHSPISSTAASFGSTGQPTGLSISSTEAVCGEPSRSSYPMPSSSQPSSSFESGAVTVPIPSDESTVRGSASDYHPPELPIEYIQEDGFFRSCWTAIVRAKGFFLCVISLYILAIIALIISQIYGSNGQPRIQVGPGRQASTVAPAPVDNIDPSVTTYMDTLISEQNITRYDDNEDDDMDVDTDDMNALKQGEDSDMEK